MGTLGGVSALLTLCHQVLANAYRVEEDDDGER